MVDRQQSLTAEVVFEEGRGAYRISYLSDDDRAAASVTVERELVDQAVLAAAAVTIELTPDGRVVAYSGAADFGTIACRTLGELVADAIADGLADPGHRPSEAIELEEQLEHALAVVRESRKRNA